MIPTLSTSRLVLRPFTRDDAKTVQQLAGHPDVAATTLTVPHPYEDGMAEVWIDGHEESATKGRELIWAITHATHGLVGCISLRLQLDVGLGDLGYWVGVPFWGNGFATEAAKGVVTHAFAKLGLRRVEAHYLARNPASGQVLAKVGMKQERSAKEFITKWGTAENVVFMGMDAPEED